MQIHRLVWAALCGGVLTLGVGCNKQEESPPLVTTAPETQKKASPSAPEVQKATEALKSAATQAVQTATPQAVPLQAVVEQATSDSAKAQAAIDNAKKFMAEGKLQETAMALSQLSGLKLTPEQEAALTQMKTSLEKTLREAMTKKPAGTLPDVSLPKK